MKRRITLLGFFLAAGLVAAQQQGAGTEAAAADAKASLVLPEPGPDLMNTGQTVTVVLGAVGLIAAAAAAPYVITYGGETRIGPFQAPYWALDAAGALIALAALNFTFNEIHHIKTQ